jgi:hypothetical protein
MARGSKESLALSTTPSSGRSNNNGRRSTPGSRDAKIRFTSSQARLLVTVQVLWWCWLGAKWLLLSPHGLYIEMVESFNSGWIHFGNSGTERFHGPTTIEAFAQELVK